MNSCYVMCSNIMWKSVNLIVDQLSLNLPQLCSVGDGHRSKVPRTRFSTRAVRFALSSLRRNCHT